MPVNIIFLNGKRPFQIVYLSLLRFYMLEKSQILTKIWLKSVQKIFFDQKKCQNQNLRPKKRIYT